MIFKYLKKYISIRLYLLLPFRKYLNLLHNLHRFGLWLYTLQDAGKLMQGFSFHLQTAVITEVQLAS